MKEILEFKKRFIRSDKQQFLEIVEQKLNELGFNTDLKHFGKIIKSINLETINDKPEYIFIAHYDTGTIIPFWMNWLMKFLGINRQLIFVFIIGVGFPLIAESLNKVIPLFLLFSLIVLSLSLFTILIPNKRNLDDNTSGVALLLPAAKFKEQKILVL